MLPKVRTKACLAEIVRHVHYEYTENVIEIQKPSCRNILKNGKIQITYNAF